MAKKATKKRTPSPRPSPVKRVLAAVLILALLIGSFLLSRDGESGPTAAASGVASLSTARAPWPAIPYEPVRYGTPRLSVPVMHRLDIDVVAASDTASPQHRLLLERLTLLITQHVDPAVATDLDSLMRQHEIIYVMEPSMNALASFHVKGGRGYMSLNARRMVALDSDVDVAGFMLVIAHEFVHYKQWKGATDPLVRATFEEGHGDRMDKRTCPILWAIEQEAYRRQCELGNGLGLHWSVGGPEMDYCARLGSEDAFDQAFYYAQAQKEEGKVKALCDDIWWDIAGGPRQ